MPSVSKEFRTKEGRNIAFNNLKEAEIDALVVIGGDGTFSGAIALQEEHDIPIIGLPGTIDNDINGTDYRNQLYNLYHLCRYQ